MKLIRSKKSDERKKQAQEAYPKVKTFSKAYDFSAPADKTGNTVFRLDERPYPVTPVPAADLPVDSLPDPSGPERFDLQDTLLTDESFAERLPERQPSAVKPDPADASAEAADHDQYMESEPSQESSDPDEAGLYLDDGSDLIRETESFYQPEPETEYEADPFYNPESVTDDEEDSCNIHSFNTKEKASPPLMPDSVSENEPERFPGLSPEEDDEPEEQSGSVSAGVELLLPKLESKGKSSLTATWSPVEDADGYDLFFARGGESFSTVFRTLSPEETAYTFSELDKKSIYKMYVVAFMKTGGLKTVICKSEIVRCITGGSTKKLTNAQEIIIRETGISLSVGEKKKISATVAGLDPDKQVLAHDSLLRYISDDTSVATVSKDGKIKGIAPGNCRIFLVAANGIRSTVNVSVQKKESAVTFKKKKYSLKVGHTINLKKKLNAEKTDNGSKPFKWKSSDKKIAEVSRKGIVTALKKGQITVRVKTGEGSHAKVRIRISASPKPNPVPWESFGTGKKSLSGKKHHRLT